MSGVAVANVFPHYELYERPYRRTSTSAATVLLVGLLLSPLLLEVPGEGTVSYPGGFLFDLCWTLAFVVGGLADHLLVARTLRPAPVGRRAPLTSAGLRAIGRHWLRLEQLRDGARAWSED